MLMFLATNRCISRKTIIQQLLFTLKTSIDFQLSLRFHTSSIVCIEKFNTITSINNLNSNNGICTPSISILLSASSIFRLNLLRKISTNLIWTESCLPEKIQSLDEYKQLYSLSIKDPNHFWTMAAERLDWYYFPTIIKNTEFDYRTKRGVDIKWYEDGILNACYNCLDRHIDYDYSTRHRIAYIFEPDSSSQFRYHVTYGELLTHVKNFANILKKHGVKKGDRVIIYMPMIVEACVASLACARIGAVYSIVFTGCNANYIAECIADCDSNVVITSDFSLYDGKSLLLKNIVDQALKMKQCQKVKTVLVFGRNHGLIKLNKDDLRDPEKTLNWTKGRDFWVHEEMEKIKDRCEPERMNAEDPLFILYTSDSTGKPKGIVHTTGGYLTHTSLTFKHIFNYQSDDVYMCTADVGYIAGHSYSIYGPLSNRATSVISTSIPTYTDVSSYWNIINKHQVNILYTSPNVIRSLMLHNNTHVTNTSRQSLKVLGSVGVPINPEAWKWDHKVVGEQRCSIIDTWWQTETGGIMIASIPNASKSEPSIATLPYFGVKTQLFDGNTQKLLSSPNNGELCIADSWPGQARTLYGNHKRFVDIYFKKYPGYYFTGVQCEMKENGYHHINSRVNNVLIISDHNINIMEVEEAIIQHPSVSEVAVVGYSDCQKIQGIYCFVILKNHVKENEELRQDIIQIVRNTIGADVTSNIIQFTSELPKTRDGKIMRDILEQIVKLDVNNSSHISILNNSNVVEDSIKHTFRTKSS